MTLSNYWNYFSGYKTYAVAIAGIIWGVDQGDTHAVLAALALVGLRSALNAAVAKVVSSLGTTTTT